MTIRAKVLGAVLITFVVIFAVLFVTARNVLQVSYADLEVAEAEDHVERAQNFLADAVNRQGFVNSDWAIWTDSYLFVTGELPDYADDNLSADGVANVNLNMMLFLTLEGDLYHSVVVDLEELEEVELPPAITEYLPDLMITDKGDGRGGFIRLDDALLLVTSRPILTGDGESEPAGTLIMGRFYGSAEIDDIGQLLRTRLEILPADTLTDGQNTTATDGIVIEVINEQTLRGRSLLTDIRGQTIGVYQVTLPRPIYEQGQAAINLMTGILAVTALSLTVVTGIMLEVAVIRRVTQLSEDVDAIQKDGDLSRRVTVDASDEVSTLARNINQMLARLAENREALKRQNTALEKAYLQAEEATRLKSMFLSTMSHELRTPLTAIIGYSGILLEGIGGEIDEEAERFIVNIDTSGHHLLALINDVLDLSKIEAGQYDIVPQVFHTRDFFGMIHQEMEVLSLKNHSRFDTRITPDVPEQLLGDDRRIRQIVINLLSNAFKFTQDGEVNLYVSWQDSHLTIRVQDTGIGIPKHAQAYIFDEFRQVDSGTTRKYGGTGLGLSIVKKLCDAMRGTIALDSEEGVGTTFTVRLPLTVAHASDLTHVE